MKILLSPAKKLDFAKSSEELLLANSVFSTKTLKLESVLKKKSAKTIGELMKLSGALSELNFERFQSMGEMETNCLELFMLLTVGFMLDWMQLIFPKPN